MSLRVAAIQLNSTADKAGNIDAAARLVAAAAADGATLVVLPEKWNLLGPADELGRGAEELQTGQSIDAARSWARELEITLVAGSIAERVDAEQRLFNTSCVIDSDGEIAAVYRKIHMFDVEVGGVSYRESEHEQPGEEIVETTIAGVELGLTICYDVRFPELYRILAVRGATVIVVPAAFTTTTGRDHWEVLLRARAIENQAFMIAPNQSGKAPPHYDSYGHSMIIGPWGEVLAVAADGEGFVCADLDLDRQEEIRSSLPSLANRRPQAYRWEVETSV